MKHHDEFVTKLALLQEILDKKQAALTDVLNISENQETLYLSPPSSQRREFLLEMGKQKQVQIDDVLACDEVFQRIFDSIADEFAQKKDEFAHEIRRLQDSINAVLQLDVKIRAQEEKGKALAAASFGRKAKAKAVGQGEINPANVNYILHKYKEASKNKPAAPQEENL
ncbi:MAG: hypothetical protein LBE55_00695 [Clostridiales bacterium]|jgi:hypothetical protein|nr:hypothetical protein [Clostridiales bacterium]